MKRKYITMFLMGLLCLVGSGDLFSQRCYVMSYDENGNRTRFMVFGCIEELKFTAIGSKVEMKSSEEADSNELALSVYPNPSKGKFRVSLNNNKELLSDIYVYDNKGILVSSGKFAEEVDVDISDKPAGVYLLRIISGDSMLSEIVVKL